MGEIPSQWSSFQDLDEAAHAEATIAWLGRVANTAPVLEGKLRSYELLKIRPGQRVLDVGCGRGDDVLALSRLAGDAGLVVGVDSSVSAIETARTLAARAAANVAFEHADASALPFAARSFDACRCDRTLQHLRDPHAALREMVRVVRPGGIVVISEGRSQIVAAPEIDLQALKAALTLFQAPDEREGWIGMMLPLIIHQAGLSASRLERVAGEITDPAGIATFYDLPRLRREGVRTKLLTAAEDAELARMLERETRRGRLKLVAETHLFTARVRP
jgi:SAM-dependent methyltransferase